MCGTCGCADKASISVDGEHVHVSADGTEVRHRHDAPSHDHDHDHEHEHTHQLPDGRLVRHTHEGGDHHHPAHGVLTGHEHGHSLDDGTVVTHTHEHHAEPLHETETRRIAVEQDLMAKNDRAAALNRARFEASSTLVVNLMSSPGSGKTTLLVRTLDALKRRSRPLAVIEGDQQTSLDADRIRATGVAAVQVNTGKGCHLDAEMVLRAVLKQPEPAGGTLFIENVGNLVCPAGFDLGEAVKVVIASVTEGEDKPLKYPDMFAVADLVLVNKVDLVDALGFDLAALERNVRRVNPKATVLEVSARSGAGFDAWLSWLETKSTRVAATSPA